MLAETDFWTIAIKKRNNMARKGAKKEYLRLLGQTFFAQNMEYIIEKTGLTREAFAQLVGRDRKSIQNLIDGNTCIFGPAIIPITKLLCCEVVELFFHDMGAEDWLAGRDIVYDGGILSFDANGKRMEKPRKVKDPVSPREVKEKELQAQLDACKKELNKLSAVNGFLYEKNSRLNQEIGEKEKEIQRLKDEREG